MQFDFGDNWLQFSQRALTSEKIEQAQKYFEKLFNNIGLKEKSFVEIGFGQGLSLLIAKQKGAVVVGCDINPKCQEALEKTRVYFSQIKPASIPLIIGSILEQDTINQLLEYSENQGFDIVHSWGVLHHTGNMEKAIHNAASLVKSGGVLVLAIYNRHWTSSIWRLIKWLYCKLPFLLQKGMVYLFYPLIWIAKYLVTKENPAKMIRGMDFFYNVVDWVGGYPYEYASKEEMVALMESLGFNLINFFPATVPTGCNEFIFLKKAN
ncbi:MAG: class I SAM-dependent methyltransferase [Candidatus Helarchaeota archaeon]